MSLLRGRIWRLTPVHLGPLLAAALLAALLALPGAAWAAADVSLSGGYDHGGGEVDYDNQGGPAVGPYVEGSTVPFRLAIDNADGADPAVGLEFQVTFPDALTVDVSTVENDNGGLSLDCSAPSEQELTCVFGTDVAADSRTIVNVNATVVDGEYGETGTQDRTAEVDTEFRVYADNGTQYGYETTTVVDSDPACEYAEGSRISLSAARAGTKGTAKLECVAPNAGVITYAIKPGLEEGQSGHTGQLAQATPSPSDPNFIWTPNADELAKGRSFGDYFVILVTANGVTIEQFIGFDVFAEADIHVTVAAPAALPVPTTGATTTYTATVTNKGPDLATDVPVALFVSTNTTYVSGAVNGAATTCEPVTFFEDLGPLAFACAVPTIAPGTSATVAVTVKFTPGVAGVTVPGTATVFALSGLFQMTPPYIDGNFADNRSATSTVALTVPSVVIVPPAPKPDANKPTKGNDKIVGTKGNDRINGGAGNDKLDGGAGRDTLGGGTGNDVLGGGAGNDKLNPGTGKDTVNAGAGNDAINAKDGAVDKITCGPGRDVVVADKNDKVAKDCEVVRRR